MGLALSMVSLAWKKLKSVENSNFLEQRYWLNWGISDIQCVCVCSELGCICWGGVNVLVLWISMEG